VHESIPATLLGHSAGGITYTCFVKGYDVNQLTKVIEIIHYDDALVSLFQIADKILKQPKKEI